MNTEREQFVRIATNHSKISKKFKYSEEQNLLHWAKSLKRLPFTNRENTM